MASLVLVDNIEIDFGVLNQRNERKLIKSIVVYQENFGLACALKRFLIILVNLKAWML